ncbi:Hypothetical protein, putative [Bodo saltans]|uniref:Uncharacterized protein n=1 Tax=Bodo saltans TaxID=75058 RepID=A0A0S4KLF5_BODSA|nr:Hypothetical protein, putative [Bodo saltans]|eukprot:CUI15320.1 Hypothetical protein, putative [Bodo saltans]
MNPTGGTHGTVQQWEASNNQRRVFGIRKYLKDVNPQLCSAVIGVLLPDLKDLHVDIGAIGIEPVTPPKTHIDSLEKSLDALSTELFGNANGVGQAVWWLCSKMNTAGALDNWEHVRLRFVAPHNEDPLGWITDKQNSAKNVHSPEISRLLQLPDFMKIIDESPLDVLRSVLRGGQAVWWLCSKMNIAALDHWENVRLRFVAPHNEDPLGWITDKQNSAKKVHSPEVSRLLQLPDFIKMIDESRLDVLRSVLPHHYLNRRVFDPVKTFWSTVEAEDTFSVLRPLHVATTATPPYLCAAQNQAYSRILRFVGKLQAAALRYHLTRNEANAVTINDWNATNKFTDDAELNQLEQDVRLIWNSVEYVFCKSKNDLIDGGAAPAVFETSTAKVSTMLPGADINHPSGGFILALLHGRAEDANTGWKGLLESTLSVHQALEKHRVPQGPNAYDRLYRLQPCDFVEYNEDVLVRTMLPLFVDPLLPSGGFTQDISKIVHWVVSQPGVHGKPSLAPPPAQGGALITPFKYIDEATSSIIAFQQRLPFELLTDEIETEVRHLVEDDPEFADAARAFIVVMIRELASLPAHLPISPLAEAAFKAMATPLLPVQERAAIAIFSRLVGNRLRTAQLIPLLTIVWEPHQMNPLARVPFDNNNPEHIDLIAGVNHNVRQLVEQERGCVVIRFLSAIKIACVMYLHSNSIVSAGFFDASVLELVLSQ